MRSILLSFVCIGAMMTCALAQEIPADVPPSEPIEDSLIIPAPAPIAEAPPAPPAPPPAAAQPVQVPANSPFGAPSQPPAPPPSEEAAAPLPPIDEAPKTYTAIKLQGLNKVTARVSTLEGAIGDAISFGSLNITARKCWKAPPEEQPENAALLEIWETKPGEGSEQIFLGWMFSSSPGLSALEHAVYDITVLTCEKPKEDAVPEKPAEKPAQKSGN